MNEQMKAMLQELASRKCWIDDLSASTDDYAGGQTDNAYSGGLEDGEALLARRLLELFGQESAE